MARIAESCSSNIYRERCWRDPLDTLHLENKGYNFDSTFLPRAENIIAHERQLAWRLTPQIKISRRMMLERMMEINYRAVGQVIERMEHFRKRRRGEKVFDSSNIVRDIKHSVFTGKGL